MMFNCTSITSVSTLEEIRKLDTDKLIEFLRKQDVLHLIEEDFDIIRNERITGYIFLDFTKEDFISYGLKRSPALSLSKFAKECREEKFSSDKKKDQLLIEKENVIKELREQVEEIKEHLSMSRRSQVEKENTIKELREQSKDMEAHLFMFRRSQIIWFDYFDPEIINSILKKHEKKSIRALIFNYNDMKGGAKFVIDLRQFRINYIIGVAHTNIEFLLPDDKDAIRRKYYNNYMDILSANNESEITLNGLPMGLGFTNQPSRGFYFGGGQATSVEFEDNKAKIKTRHGGIDW